MKPEFRPLKPLLAVAAMAALSACGDEVTQVTEVTEVTQVVGMQVVDEGEALPECTAEKEGVMVYSMDSAAAYYCIGGKWVTMKGKDGKDGRDGVDGKDGRDGIDGKDGTNGIDGKDGRDGVDGVNGRDGTNGVNGTNGTNGINGTSCTAVKIDNGYKLVCGGDSVGVVLNGADGINGTDGADGSPAFMDISVYDPLANTVSDFRDGKTYKTMAIYASTDDEQIWMAENLNYASLAPTADTDSSSFCLYDDPAYCAKYGRLYLWSAAMDSAGVFSGGAKGCGYTSVCKPKSSRGVCPRGWHLPSEGEFSALLKAYGGTTVAAKNLKSVEGWPEDDFINPISIANRHLFAALPGGCWFSHNDYDNWDGDYSSEKYASFWASSESDSDHALSMTLMYRAENASMDDALKSDAYSIRCVKDKVSAF